MAKDIKPILKVNKLTKIYGNNTVVKGVSFEVDKGEVFGIVGPNGAGKTSTIEMIEGLVTINSGTAIVDGIDVSTDPNKVREIIGVQPQSPAFLDKLYLTELLNLFAALYGTKIDSAKILKDVNLSEKSKSYFDDLSGGQKQRFSIATALVNEPRVLFLDEPSTGLDPQARLNLWDLIRNIKRQGITVIITTHYMEEAEQLCDRVAIMDQGSIIDLNTPENLIKQLIKRGFKKEKHIQEANLEDVFIDLTGRKIHE